MKCLKKKYAISLGLSHIVRADYLHLQSKEQQSTLVELFGFALCARI